MKEKNDNRELPEPTETDIIAAKQFTEQYLGQGFSVDYASMPRNVGSLGDDGFRGDSTVIGSEAIRPASIFADNYDLIEKLASEICNHTTTTKVLIDVTPKDLEPRFTQAELPEDHGLSLEEYTRYKVQVYPKLAERYWEQLKDPLMCRAVLAIIAHKDAARERRKGHARALTIREEAGIKQRHELEKLSAERISQGKKPITIPINLLR